MAKNICIACSGGGHLMEILQIKESYDSFRHFYLTFKRENSINLAKKEKVYFVTDPARSLWSLIKCTAQSFLVLLKEKPDVIISIGAGVTIPACYMGKYLFGCKVVYIESFCRIDEPSWSGKLTYPIADRFFVLWKKVLDKYGDKAEYVGSIV